MLRCSNWKPDCMHASTSLVCLAEIVGEFRCHFIYTSFVERIMIGVPIAIGFQHSFTLQLDVVEC